MSTLTDIEARLSADRDNFGGGWTDQSIRDREALLAMVRAVHRVHRPADPMHARPGAPAACWHCFEAYPCQTIRAVTP